MLRKCRTNITLHFNACYEVLNKGNAFTQKMTDQHDSKFLFFSVNIKSLKVPWKYFKISFVARGVFRTLSNIQDGAFWENNYRLSCVHHFRKKAPMWILDTVLNTPLVAGWLLLHLKSMFHLELGLSGWGRNVFIVDPNLKLRFVP